MCITLCSDATERTRLACRQKGGLFSSVFLLLPIAAELAVKIRELFYLCKGETSQQQGSEG